jgi:hypothetical protein
MLLDRIHPHFKKATEHTNDAAEHAAVVELLVLAVFSDKSVDVSELDALDSFDASHADWDEGPFSIQQYLPTATAKVRSALDEPGGGDVLLKDAISRITSPSLREAAVGYCEEILRVDGITDDEREFLRQATRQLSFPAS